MTEISQYERAKVAIATSGDLNPFETVLTTIYCILYALMLVANCLDFREAIS